MNVEVLISKMAEEVKAGVDIERIVDKYINCESGEFRQGLIDGIRYMVEKKGPPQMNAILKNVMINKMSMAKIEENESGEYTINVSEQELLALCRNIHRAKIVYHDHYVLYSLILEIDRKGEEIVDRYIDKIIGELNNLSKK